MTPKSLRGWGAAVSQWLGIVGLLACFIVWVLTHQVEPAFLTAFGGLIVGGQGAEAMTAMRACPPAPPPVPDTTLEELRAVSRGGR